MLLNQIFIFIMLIIIFFKKNRAFTMYSNLELEKE